MTNFSLSITEIVLSILCSILKAETVIQEKLSKEKQSSPSSTSALSASINYVLRGNVMIASAPTTNVAVVTSSATPTTSTLAAATPIDATVVAPSSDASTIGDATAALSDEALLLLPPPPAAADTAAAGTSGSSGGDTDTDAPAAPVASAPELTTAPVAPLNHHQYDDDDDDDHDDLDVNVNLEHLQALMDMGFPEQRCLSAIARTNTVEQATEFLLMTPAIDPPEGDDIEMSEDAQMLQAIAMSLATDTLVQEATSAAPLDEAGTSSNAVASESASIALLVSEADTAPVTNIAASTATPVTVTASASVPIITTVTPIAAAATTTEVAATTVSTVNSASAVATVTVASTSASSPMTSESSAANSMVDIIEVQIPKRRKPYHRHSLSIGSSPKLNDTPLSKEVLDEFTNNILEGCLRQLDSQGEIVYKVCDLLSTCSKRNGSEWLHGILSKLVDEINSQGLTLKKIAGNAKNAEDVKELWASDVANKFAIRLHLITLLMEEVRDSCTQEIDSEGLINNLTSLLCDTEAAMATLPQPLSGQAAAAAAAPPATTTAAPGSCAGAESSRAATAPRLPTNTASSSVSMLLMPQTPGEAQPPQISKERSTVTSCTPKWIAPAMLFMDLYEKIFLAARKRMTLLKVYYGYM